MLMGVKCQNFHGMRIWLIKVELYVRCQFHMRLDA